MPANVTAPARAPAGRLEVAADWAEFLGRCGVADPDAVMELSGEVVCGHADRHVRRVVMTDGVETRVAYLKREHTASLRAKWKNWRAGAGWVSRCAREAATLTALRARGLPGPRPAAWGRDSAGRAFLLVAELNGSTELRDWLAPGRDGPARRALARRLGESLAALHDAGFPTPDLAAKHVYVGDAGGVTLLDWQGAIPSPAPVPLRECLRPLATLDASLAADLASPRERILVLNAYLRTRGVGDFARVAAAVRAESRRRARRSSSVRDQRGGDSTRLIWLAGEAACAAARFAPDWPTPPAGQPFYPGPRSGGVGVGVVRLGESRVRVERFRTFDPLGRLLAALRERPWRSPGAEAGRILVHLARHGVPGPVLVGFGQSLGRGAVADSFVAFLDDGSGEPLDVVFNAATTNRDRLIAESCALLRRLHDAGLRPTGGPSLFVTGGLVHVASPMALRRSKRVGPRAARADLRALFVRDLPGAGADERRAGITAYYKAGSA